MTIKVTQTTFSNLPIGAQFEAANPNAMNVTVYKCVKLTASQYRNVNNNIPVHALYTGFKVWVRV